MTMHISPLGAARLALTALALTACTWASAWWMRRAQAALLSPLVGDNCLGAWTTTILAG